MVTIIKTKVSQNKEGKSFVSIKLQGDPECIQSQQTGQLYLTAKVCYITTTFDLATANGLIGTKLPGTIVKVSSAPYQYPVKETGEVITLSHRYEYKPYKVPEEGGQRPLVGVMEQIEELQS
jgi:hypothetical protein